jgi:hypothetical protein
MNDTMTDLGLCAACPRPLREWHDGEDHPCLISPLRPDDPPEVKCVLAREAKDKAARVPKLKARMANQTGLPEKGAPNEPGVSLDDFVAYMPMHSYLYVPTRELWPATSVNSRIPNIRADGKPLKASVWLDRHKPVEQMTWAPGEPMIIADRLVDHGGWIPRRGVCCFNLYRPPAVQMGDPSKAGLWLDHVRTVYPDDADRIIVWCAHRVQRPQEKINHALVLGGIAGIGKDTIVEPVKNAVGPWNCREVNPQQALGRFNPFVKSVILRVSECRDLGEENRYQFYEHMKSYIAAPPDVLLCDEKHLREHSVFNVCGVIITTNHKSDGLYLPEDDRRHDVMWSDLTPKDFSDSYWNNLYGWYGHGGNEHVAAYLSMLDLSAFNPKAPPKKTEAFWALVNASRAPEDAELADIIDKLGNPDILTVSKVAGYAERGFADWLSDRKNSRRIPHRFEGCGYVAVRNEHAKDGLWKIAGKRQVIYAKASVPLRDRIAAALLATGAR